MLGTDLPLWIAKELDVTREQLAPVVNVFPKVLSEASCVHRLASCHVPLLHRSMKDTTVMFPPLH